MKHLCRMLALQLWRVSDRAHGAGAGNDVGSLPPASLDAWAIAAIPVRA